MWDNNHAVYKILPFGDLTQEYALDGPKSKEKWRNTWSLNVKQTQEIPVEPSTALSTPQSHEQRNKSVLPLGLGEVYYAALLWQEDE